MAQILELEPFPLGGICASHLGEIQEELDNSFIKVLIKLIGKNEIAPKALTRLSEKLSVVLGGGKLKSLVEVISSTEDTCTVSAIIFAKTSAPRLSALSLNSGASNQLDAVAKIRETLKTTVHRQNASKKLGEDAELVPYTGFSVIEIGPEEDLTTREVCEIFVKTKTVKTKNSYIEMLIDEEPDFVGAAGTIIIHSWASPFKSIWQSLEPELQARGDETQNVFIWLDIFSIPQHSPYAITPRWLTTTLCNAIGSIGSSVLVLADWKNPVPFTRLWCIWELLATIQQGTELSVVMPPNQRKSFDERLFHDLPFVIKSSFDAIDSEHSSATIKNDEVQILSSIRDSIGFDGANLVVKDRLLEWLALVSEVTARDPERTRDHLATATFCFRLAKIMSAGQGKHAEAESMLRRAVNIRTVELGADADLTIECQIALANVFRLQGKSSEAEVTLRKVCESMNNSKGPEHEDTLLALATLSRVLVDRGNFDEAEKICVSSLAIAEVKFGIKDKRTLETLVTLSQLADLRCDSDAAATRLRKALEGFEGVFGLDAPQTLNVKADLAGFLAELENFDEAEALFKEASEKLTIALGASHEWTIKATTGLSVLAKVKEGLGPNYIAGKFASKAAVPSIPTTIPETSETTLSTKSPLSTVTVPSTSNNNNTSPSLSASPKKKISFDPNLTEKAANNEIVGEVTERLNSLRETRHEKIKKNASSRNNVGPASRKHLRGWLEKLPVELSQRERERLARKNEQGGGSGTLKNTATTAASPAKPAQGRSMLLKIASSVGSTVGFSTKADKRKSVPNMGSSFSSMNTDVIKLKRIEANWEKRFFQAQSNQKKSTIVYWLNDDDCKNGRDVRDYFDLDDVNTRIFETSPFGPTAFSVTGPKGRLHLRATTVELKHEWLVVIRDALNFRGAADKAKLLDPNGSIPAAVEENRAFFSGSFVNMDSLLGQHSQILPSGEDLLRRSMLEMMDDDHV